MRKLIASEWITLDGVYDADTMDQWFQPYDCADRQDYIREQLFASDDILIGRVTYEMFAAYWPQQKNDEFGMANRLNTMPKHVVSTTLKRADWNNSTIIKGQVAESILNLKRAPGRDIQLYGSGALVRSLMPLGLIDEYRFLVQPVIMGSGKRFFQDGMTNLRLKLTRTRPMSSGTLLICQEPVAIGSVAM